MMRANVLAGVVVGSLTLLGCGGGSAVPADDGSGGGDGGCSLSGGPSFLDGVRCVTPGVPPELCGQGFSHDGDGGCVAELPAESCAPGTMALPGEAACRAVVPCGTGPWGDIPIETGTTLFVDAGNVPPGTGTQSDPFVSVSDAFAIASDGALIAVAAGIYTETLTVIGKSVRVWGVCPELVTVTGTMATPIASVLVREGASGTEIRNLSITGSAPTATALAVSGAEDVVIDGVWVHDALGLGVEVVNALGPTSAFITNSLVELNQDSGVTIFASTVSLTDVVIRDNGSAPSLPTRERGIDIETDIDLGLGADVEVRHAVIEQHGDHGIYASGAQLSIDSTLVRDVDARASDDLFGRGIASSWTSPPALVRRARSPAPSSSAPPTVACSSTPQTPRPAAWWFATPSLDRTRISAAA